MLVVKIELHSAVTGKVTTLATGTIANTGTGTPASGDYRIELRDAAGRKWKSGAVIGFPRKRLLAWDLLYRALRKLVGDRNPTLDSSPFPVLKSRATATQQHNAKGTNDDRAPAQPGRDSQSP